MKALPVVVIALASATAHADGVYFHQMFGIGNAETPLIGKTIQTRAGIGARVSSLAIEAWAASDSAPARDGALLGLVGGEPLMGTDLASYGVALRTIVPIHHTEKVAFEGYTRIGAGIVEASGRLDGYAGHSLGVGGGFQVRGRVRALGFAWAPLFFLKKGPKVTGALFVDYGYDRLELMRGDREIHTRTNHLLMGFAIGSAF